jgi:hypothetical protein
MQHQMHFAALNKPVAFETEWNAQGILTPNQTSGQLSNYRFDRSAEGQGFPIRTGTAVLDAAKIGSDDYGWLELEGAKVGVPFWNSLDADLRVANIRRGNDLVAEPTVVLKKGELALRNAEQRNKDVLKDGNAVGSHRFRVSIAGLLPAVATRQWPQRRRCRGTSVALSRQATEERFIRA